MTATTIDQAAELAHAIAAKYFEARALPSREAARARLAAVIEAAHDGGVWPLFTAIVYGVAMRSFCGAVCRVCKCTDEDCSQCIARTGRPCHWLAQDLCSACAEDGSL